MRATTSLALILGLARVCLGQSGFSGSIGLNSVSISVESKLEPSKPDWPSEGKAGFEMLGRGKTEGKAGISRYSTNKKTHQYFGYDLTAELIDAKAGTYRVTFSALTMTPEEIGLSDATNWQMLPPPIFPLAQIVSGADIIALDLFENPATGQKVVDYIRVGRRNCEADAAPIQISCLAGLLEDAKRELEKELKHLESTRDAATVAAIRDSQKAWEKYRDDACSSLAIEAKRLECERRLTMSRTHDLGQIY
jgi:uncharacterized protein YecT (DUF1311 family)